MRTVLAIVLTLAALSCAWFQHGRAQGFLAERDLARGAVVVLGGELEDRTIERDSARRAAMRAFRTIEEGNQFVQVAKHLNAHCRVQMLVAREIVVRYTPSGRMTFRGYCGQPKRRS